MIANKNISIDALIDLVMAKLFLLAEYVCDKTSFRSVKFRYFWRREA